MRRDIFFGSAQPAEQPTQELAGPGCGPREIKAGDQQLHTVLGHVLTGDASQTANPAAQPEGRKERQPGARSIST